MLVEPAFFFVLFCVVNKYISIRITVFIRRFINELYFEIIMYRLY